MLQPCIDDDVLRQYLERSVAAQLTWRLSVLGAIEKGRYGDVIAVRGNPLEDIGVLQDADVVIRGGLVFRLPTSR